jgi:intein-encoded DNA endonuclease-like protein
MSCRRLFCVCEKKEALVIRITKDEAVSRYKNGASTKEIAQLAGASSRYIRQVLNESGITLTKRRTNGYKVNEDFFRRWSAEMAYVLGFILTDGCISGNMIIISQKDHEILDRIRGAIETNNPIRKRKNGRSHIHTLVINRKSMVEDLAKLGIGEKKSLTVKFPEVPSEYLHHFIRGVVDGDGWVQDRGYVMKVTSGSANFSYALCDVLIDEGFNARVTSDNNVFRVTVSGKQDVIKLGEWLYVDCGDLLLERKRQRFEVNKKTPVKDVS